MSTATQKTRWKLLVGITMVAVGCVAVWQIATLAMQRSGPPANAIMVVAPYWYNGTWVFDDEAVNLKREPFVAGVPEMIDVLVKDIPDSKSGFRLLSPRMRSPATRRSSPGCAAIRAETITSSMTLRWRDGFALRCSGTTRPLLKPSTSRRRGFGVREKTYGLVHRRKSSLLGSRIRVLPSGGPGKSLGEDLLMADRLIEESEEGVIRLISTGPKSGMHLARVARGSGDRHREDRVRRSARAIVLGSRGPVFCSGHDLGEMVGRTEADYRRLFALCSRVMLGLRRLPQPVIARVQGWRRRPAASSSRPATWPWPPRRRRSPLPA